MPAHELKRRVHAIQRVSDFMNEIHEADARIENRLGLRPRRFGRLYWITILVCRKGFAFLFHPPTLLRMIYGTKYLLRFVLAAVNQEKDDSIVGIQGPAS